MEHFVATDYDNVRSRVQFIDLLKRMYNKRIAHSISDMKLGREDKKGAATMVGNYVKLLKRNLQNFQCAYGQMLFSFKLAFDPTTISGRSLSPRTDMACRPFAIANQNNASTADFAATCSILPSTRETSSLAGQDTTGRYPKYASKHEAVYGRRISHSSRYHPAPSVESAQGQYGSSPRPQEGLDGT